MKHIYKYLFCFILVMNCTDSNNLLDDIAIRGGYVQFEEDPTLELNIIDLENDIILESLIDPNENIISYSLTLYYNDIVVNDFYVINSFPANLELSASDFTNALGISTDDIELDTVFSLVATIITSDTGTYSGVSPDYDDDNVNEGGDTTTRLKSAALLDAVEFDVAFYQPPAKTIRMTSFEEVAIGSTIDTYDRNGSSNETIDLINGLNAPFVDYIAIGTSSTDEIGFNTEYYAVADISSSSIGFFNERIGVYSMFEDYDAYPDGVQGFHIEDADGGLRITFDTVEVPAEQTDSGLSFQVYFGDTSWESKDGIYAYVNITTDSGSEVIDMVNIYDNDIEAVAGVWNTYNTGFMKDVRSYQLVIEASSGATAESFDFDNIIVYEPEE